MKYLLILLIFVSTKVYSKSPEGKGLICAFGEKRNVYETYLFYEKKYISKYIFLENDTYKVRKNEKRNYFITKNFINIKPFIINKKSLKIINTEFNRIIGSCEIVSSHNKAIEFIHQIKNIYQKKIDRNLGRISI
tara:strand:+ start:211 stop:615 length:405 start_codon:yes stop_codon:yes gene_type:complete